MAKVAMVLVIVLLTTFSDGSAAPQNEVKVVASLTPYQSIAEEIIGDKGTVESIAAARQDAHFVQAKPSFSIMLARADLLLATGLDLEVCDQERLAMNAGRLGLETDGGGAVLAGGVWLRPQGRTAASAL